MSSRKIIIFTGPSGVGKGTLRDIFFCDEDFKLSYSVSATTRQPRDGEIDGKDYYFLSKENFISLVDENKFLEHAEFAGNNYGTLNSEIERIFDEGSNVFLEIEPQGGMQIISSGRQDIISIFIAPPSIDELEKRLRGRNTENEEQISKRLLVAQEEINIGKENYNHFLVNDNIEHCIKKIKDILKSEL